MSEQDVVHLPEADDNAEDLHRMIRYYTDRLAELAAQRKDVERFRDTANEKFNWLKVEWRPGDLVLSTLGAKPAGGVFAPWQVSDFVLYKIVGITNGIGDTPEPVGRRVLRSGGLSSEKHNLWRPYEVIHNADWNIAAMRLLYRVNSSRQ